MKQKFIVVALAIFLIALAAVGAATSTDVLGSATDDGKCYGLGLGHGNHDDDGDGEDDKQGNGHHKERCEPGSHGAGGSD